MCLHISIGLQIYLEKKYRWQANKLLDYVHNAKGCKFAMGAVVVTRGARR